MPSHRLWGSLAAILVLALAGALLPQLAAPAPVAAMGEVAKGELIYRKIIGGRLCADRFDLPFQVAQHPKLGQIGKLTFRAAQQNRLIRSGPVLGYIDESGTYQEVTFFTTAEDRETVVGYALYAPGKVIPPNRPTIRRVNALSDGFLTDVILGGDDAAAARRFVRRLNAGSGVCAYLIRVKLPPRQAAALIDLMGVADVGAARAGLSDGEQQTCSRTRVRAATLVEGGASYDVSVRDLSLGGKTSRLFDVGAVEGGSARFGGVSEFVPGTSAEFDPRGTVDVDIVPGADDGTVGVRVSGDGVTAVLVTVTDRSTGDTWWQRFEGDPEGRGFTSEARNLMFTTPPPTAIIISGSSSFDVSVRDRGRVGDQFVFRPGDTQPDSVTFLATGIVTVGAFPTTDDGTIGFWVDGSEVGSTEITVTDRRTGQSWVQVATGDEDNFGAIEIADRAIFRVETDHPCPTSPSFAADLLVNAFNQVNWHPASAAAQIQDSFLTTYDGPTIPGDIDGNGILDLVDVGLMTSALARVRAESTVAEEATVDDLVRHDYDRNGFFDSRDITGLERWVTTEVDPDTGVPYVVVPDVNFDFFVDDNDLEGFSADSFGSVPVGHPLDLNRDGFKNAADREIVVAGLAQISELLMSVDYDLNGDRSIDRLDVEFWDERVKATGQGLVAEPSPLDLDLDGFVTGNDRLQVEAAVYRYIFIDPNYSADANGDGVTDRLDVIRLEERLRQAGPGPVPAGSPLDANRDGVFDEQDPPFLQTMIGNATEASQAAP